MFARRLPADELTPAEQAVLNELFALHATVENAKQEFRGGGDGPAAAVEGFLANLDRLRRVNADAYTAAVTRLRAMFTDADGGTA